MKKIITLFTMFLLFGIVSFVSAAPTAVPTLYGENNTNINDTVEIVEAGTVPGDFLYSFDKAFDNLNVALTFNKEKKVEKSLRVADERLAETESLLERGDNKNAEIAQKNYDNQMNKTKATFSSIDAKDEDSLRSLAKIQENIDRHEQRVLAVKAKVFDKLSENMTDEEIAILEEVFANFEAKIKDARNNVLEKKDENKRRFGEISNLTDEEVANRLKEIEDEEGISKNRELRLIRKEEHFNNKISEKERKLLYLETLLKNENLTEEKILEIKNNISEIKNNISEIKNDKETEIESEGFEDIKNVNETRRDALKKMDDVRKKIHKIELKIIKDNSSLDLRRQSIQEAKNILNQAKIAYDSEKFRLAYDLAKKAKNVVGDDREEIESPEVPEKRELPEVPEKRENEVEIENSDKKEEETSKDSETSKTTEEGQDKADSINSTN